MKKTYNHRLIMSSNNPLACFNEIFSGKALYKTRDYRILDFEAMTDTQQTKPSSKISTSLYHGTSNYGGYSAVHNSGKQIEVVLSHSARRSAKRRNKR